ncbi:MAG: UbiD family decarboxylase, partial [Betaproteobacteria bacterium]|nr:UbiD family decarboxylase [Betaproteobacteria bacterium]
MPFEDLPEFIKYLETQGELVRIREEVDPKYQISAYIRKTSDLRGPALLFENVKGSDIPVVGGLFSNIRQVLLALGASGPQQAVEMLVEAMGNPIASITVPDGPCREVVYRGDDVDLGRLPVPTYAPKDGGPFITMGVVISRDPETGNRNVGIYRLQVKGKRKLGILAQQVSIQLARAEAKNQGLPV